MTPAARLQAAIELLDRIGAESPAAEWILRDYFRRRRYAGSGDRRATGQTVFTVLRQRGQIDWRLEQVKLPVDNRLRVFLSVLLEDEAANLPEGQGPHGPVPPTGEEVEALSAARALDVSEAPLPARAGFPAHLLDDLAATYGADLERAMLAQIDDVAAVDIRVNRRKSDRDTVLARLQADGIGAAPFGWTDATIRLDGRPELGRHPLATDGSIEVQDAGSQLVAALVGARPGEQVADFCAGAGGKTLAMGAAMQNSGSMRHNTSKRTRKTSNI